MIIDDPQARFLFYCLQGRFNPSSLELARATASQKGFDWLTLSELVEKELLAPLLYTIANGRDLLPPQLERQFREIYLQNAVRNAILLNNLTKILAACAAIGIDLIVLKGAALAEVVYNNIAVRPMVDIDILVRRTDVEETLLLLQSLGYIAAAPETRPGSLIEYENELLLHKEDQFNIALELHWSLLDSPYYQQKIDMTWFWQTAVPAQFKKKPGLVLGAEALLLHLCSHIMLHHRGEGLLWLHDVAEVLVRFNTSLDWETLLAKAQEYDLVLSVQRIVSKVSSQWRIELPPGIPERVNALHSSPRERQIFDWLTTTDRPVAQRFWVDLASVNNWRRRITYAWHNLFPTGDYMRKRYDIRHSGLLPLYYPYRWLLGIFSLFRN